MFEARIDALVADETLSNSRVFTNPDAAAKEVLNVMAPLSREYNLEVGGNILTRTVRGRVLYRYTIPVIGAEASVAVASSAIGYPTHPSGPLHFSNNIFHSSSEGNDAAWVRQSGRPLYLGVQSAAGGIGVAVCPPGNCSLVEYGGTAGRRIQ